MARNPTASVGAVEDLGSTPGLGGSPGVGNGNPLQYSCLGNLTDRGSWQATVHGVTESRTRLSTHAGMLQNTRFAERDCILFKSGWCINPFKPFLRKKFQRESISLRIKRHLISILHTL